MFRMYPFRLVNDTLARDRMALSSSFWHLSFSLSVTFSPPDLWLPSFATALQNNYFGWPSRPLPYLCCSRIAFGTLVHNAVVVDTLSPNDILFCRCRPR